MKKIDALTKWTEAEKVISLSETSDGTTGKEWIERLRAQGIYVSDYAEKILRSESFVSTNGVPYEINVLKGDLFSDHGRTNQEIIKVAKNRNLSMSNFEIVCLCREKLTDRDLELMGLKWIVSMQEPFKDFKDDLVLFGFGHHFDSPWIGVSPYSIDGQWSNNTGFAFVSS